MTTDHYDITFAAWCKRDDRNFGEICENLAKQTQESGKGTINVLVDFLGHNEGLIRPVQALASSLHLLGAEGSTMNGIRVGLVGRAVSNGGGDLQQRRHRA